MIGVSARVLRFVAKAGMAIVGLCCAGVLGACASDEGATFGGVERGHGASATKPTARGARGRASISYEGVRTEWDVEYLGPGRTERLDLYMPAMAKPGVRFPGVVIIHGGGWLAGDKGASREQNIGTTLARAGYVCASINYVLAAPGRPTWPRNLRDCKTAVQFLRQYADRYQVDADHIGVIGGSAGGHLAAMVALAGPEAGLEPTEPYAGVSSRVQAAVVMYGITDLLTRKRTQPDGTPIDGAITEGGTPVMLGAGRDENPRLWVEASPVSHVTAGDPPVLILHGTADVTVDYDQSVELDKKLRAAGVAGQLILIKGARHTFDLQPPQRDLRPVVVGFFDKYLKR